MDTSVLINLIHGECLWVLSRLANVRAVAPAEVAEEVAQADQRASLEDALRAGVLVREDLSDTAVLEDYAGLRVSLDKGEAACLALATFRAGAVACDEKRAFRRLAVDRLGGARVFTTVDILLAAIRQGLLTVDQADAIKATLETRRYQMPFTSFRELMAGPAPRDGEA